MEQIIFHPDLSMLLIPWKDSVFSSYFSSHENWMHLKIALWSLEGVYCSRLPLFLLTNYLDLWLYTGFPDGSVGEELACQGEDAGLILGSGISPGEGNDSPPQ